VERVMELYTPLAVEHIDRSVDVSSSSSSHGGGGGGVLLVMSGDVART